MLGLFYLTVPDDWQKVILEIDRLIVEGSRSVKEVPEDNLLNKY